MPRHWRLLKNFSTHLKQAFLNHIAATNVDLRKAVESGTFSNS